MKHRSVLAGQGCDAMDKFENRRVVDICKAYAASVRYEKVSLADLCALTGHSERRLRDAFYDRCGASPTYVLRAMALEGARRALLQGAATRDPVTRAANDFGFSHLSRFAAQYRQLFGETPSETLVRAMQVAS